MTSGRSPQHEPCPSGAVLRKEDQRFLTGRGQYVDDLRMVGQLYAVMVRSRYASARLCAIHCDEARACAGVRAVFTGHDLRHDDIGRLRCIWKIKSRDGSLAIEPCRFPMPCERTRYVGEVLAVVIATSPASAAAAAARIRVDYEPLPAVVDARQALLPGAPELFTEAPGNLCFDFERGDEQAVNAAFQCARHVVRLELTNQRTAGAPIEPRAALASFDRTNSSHTLFTSSQIPQGVATQLPRIIADLDPERLRVVSPDVGGGFGAKIPLYPEETIVLWAAGKLACPIKWTATRSEAFQSDVQGRDHFTRAELALDREGKFLALRVETTANLGAYLSIIGPAVPTVLYALGLAGCYTTPAIHVRVRGAFTNTVPVDSIRGAGRPEASFLIERLVDVAARELHFDPIELRRRNFIRSFPYPSPLGVCYDAGNYEATLALALEKSAYSSFAERRAAAAARGKLRGIGLSTYLEIASMGPTSLLRDLGAEFPGLEGGAVFVSPDGKIQLFTGTHSHGQGHETTFSQLAAAALGVSLDDVTVLHGDTAVVPAGGGTVASRSHAVGGSALVTAFTSLIGQGQRVAAELLGVPESAVRFDHGRFSAPGRREGVGWAEVARASRVDRGGVLEPGLQAFALFEPRNLTYPAGCHVVELEIDPDTGQIELCATIAVDDFGCVTNPLIVAGQVHGGLAHGLGQALLEQCAYHPQSGEPLNGTFEEYALPRASHLPSFVLGTATTVAKDNPLGAKGCGEAGAVGVCPALINAVVDALAGHGVRHLDMPATPERVWRALRTSRGANTGERP